MLRIFRRKKKIHRDIAVEKFLTHCAQEGVRIEALLSSALRPYCDGSADRPLISKILERTLMSFQDGRLQANQRSLFAAHCYAITVSKGLKAAYEIDCIRDQARVIDSIVSRLIAEQEVGSVHVGRAPNPYPTAGGHVLYAADTLVGGVPSQQLSLVQRYRRLRSANDALSTFCLAFCIVPAGAGIGIGVFEEVPGSRHGGVAGYDLVGHRIPDADEVDEWSSDLEILDPDQVLAPLPTDVHAEMLAAIDGVDPFWRFFSDSHTLTWR